MLARSTAWRQGLGWISAKNTSIRYSLPSRTSRLAGLMSRWARLASQSLRTMPSPWSMMASSTSASPISLAPSMNSKTIRYSRSGVSSATPYGGAGQPGPLHQGQRVVLLLDQPLDGVERLLVLQAAVQQRPAELVGAVGTEVAAGVQLAEDIAGGAGLVLDLDPQRGGAGRPDSPNGSTSSASARAGRPRPGGSPRRGARPRPGGRCGPACR